MKGYHILVVLLVAFVIFSHLTAAADLEIEKDLQNSLKHGRSMLSKAQETLERGLQRTEKTDGPKAAELRELLTHAEDIRIAHLILQERFKIREEHVKNLGAKAAQRHQVMVANYLQVLEKYIALIDLLESLPAEEKVPESLVHELSVLLDKLLYKQKPRIFGSLPYRTLKYPAKTPVETPSIQPAYEGGNTTVAPDDLKSTPEASITEEIAALAESLEWNPALIYEWVKNNIATEWYWGSMKGAVETLRQKSGNDCDQATLLMALLRASGYPTRYVRGVIEFLPDIELVKNLTGIDDPLRIAVFFQKAGIPYQPVLAGGTITNFQIEHIWVESQVPFANFHGAVLDEHGKVWVALDTSIKAAGYTYNDSLDISQDFSLSAIRDQYLSTVRDQTLLEYLQTEIEANAASYEDYLRMQTLNPEVLHILPASLQSRQIHISHEYTEIPPELIHQVRFVARDTNNNELFDITLDTFKLSNQQIAISYEPETVEDHEIINFYGGLGNTPAYLVRLRPTLQLNGENIVVSREGLPIGAEYDLTVELISPNDVEQTTNTHITGNYAVIGIVAQQAVTPEPVPDEEKDAWRLLYEEALSYINRWNQAEEELAGLLQLSLTRPVPTVVTLGGVLDVTYLLDTPHGVEWKGLYVDTDIKAVEVVVGNQLQGGDDLQKEFMRLSSLQGSILEHQIFEDDFQVKSISTAKLFQLANESQLPILFLDNTNIESLLPTLPFAEGIKEDLRNAVNQGLTVKIPESELTYEDWTGIGYIKEEPGTGATGWMLSGNIAGGMTAGPWPETLLERFANAYSAPPNTDPDSAYYMYKIPETDMQEGRVGEALAKRLQVIVLDKEGRPVKGVEVTFTVKAGGGTVYGNMPVLTDVRGVASVAFKLGQKTSANPTFYKSHESDRYWQQVGENLVDASLASGLSLPQPFIAYGFPTLPTKIIKIYGDHDQSERMNILSFAGFVSVRVEDQYENPVANIPITFAVQSPENLSTCSNPNQDTRPAQLIQADDLCLKTKVSPTLGECSSERDTLEVRTDAEGKTLANILLGGIPDAKYPISATYSNLSQTFLFYTLPFGDCDSQNADPSDEFRITSVYPTDAYGTNIYGMPTGKNISLYARAYYLRENEKNGTECNETCTKIVGSREYYIDTDFTSSEVKISGLPCVPQQAGTYLCTHKITSGVNSITFDAKAAVNRQYYNNNCAKDPPECSNVLSNRVVELATSTTMTLYGVDAQVGAGTNGDLLVDKDGFSLKDYKITSSIKPAEYQAHTAFVQIYKDGEPVHAIETEKTGTGAITLSKGYYFDLQSTYTARVILNVGKKFQGESLEIKSNTITLPIRPFVTELEAEASNVITVIDRINQEICGSLGKLNVKLGADANVTVKLNGVVLESTAGVLLENVPFPAGNNQVFITTDMVPVPGEHEFTVTAEFTEEDISVTKTVTGTLHHEVIINAFLPVGHTLVKNVDIQDGHLAVEREDLAIPGLGPSLMFKRTYGSSGNRGSGPVGAGWTHNYHSFLTIDDCLRITVIGGEGSGMRFSQPQTCPEGLCYKTQVGYHGSLIYHSDDSYDFYTKARIRYHYEKSPDPQKSNQYSLRYIEDPNGNRLTLTYEQGPPFTLNTVQDDSGRTLEFEYAEYGSPREARIVRITGPMGLEVNFDYDQYGNLLSATRDVKSEFYEYTTSHDRDRHNLTRITDPNGNVTVYSYYSEEDSPEGYPPTYDWSTHALTYPEKHEFVKSVTEAFGTPDAATTTFHYDFSDRTRIVTKGRRDSLSPGLRYYSTTYTLNSYGYVTKIENPLGHTTETTWALDVGINDVYVVNRTDAEGKTIHYEYDVNGNLTKITDEMGLVKETIYDQTFNKPLKITDANGHSTEFSYDNNGNLLQVTDPDGNSTVHTYDNRGNRETTTDANQKTTQYTYDQYGNIATITDPEGGFTENLYDKRSRLKQSIQTIRPVNGNAGKTQKTTYTYDQLDRRLVETFHLENGQEHTNTKAFDANGNILYETDENGNPTWYYYDALNRVIEEEDAYHNSTHYVYDQSGNKIRETDKNGNTTIFMYDAADRLEKVRNAEGNEAGFIYDKVGNKRFVTDYNQNTTEFTYDSRYRLWKVKDALGNETEYEYDNVGNKLKETDPYGRKTEFVYDKLNRLTAQIDNRGNASTIDYDAVGNKLKETDRNQHSTFYEYDGNKRLILIRDHLDYTIAYIYDDAGNKVAETDQNGHTVRYEYDELNRKIKAIDPLGYEREYTYDGVGNVTKIVDAEGNETELFYDKLNRPEKAAKVDPSTGTTLEVSFTYDANGNKLSEKNARGYTTTYSYDNMNRLESIKDPLGKSERYFYDRMGNKTQEIDKKGTVATFIYDDLNRLKKEIKDGIVIREVNYDKVGNIDWEKDANGNITKYYYDDLYRLERKEAPYATITSYTYDNEANLLTETDPEGHTTTLTYDALNRVLTLTDAEQNTTRNEYDGVGNTVKVFEPKGNNYVTEFIYDKNNRLIQVIDAYGNNTEYSYDGNGNRLSQKDANGNLTTYEYDSFDLPIKMTQHYLLGNLSAEFAYDENGNRTDLTDPKGQHIHFSYDALDRPVLKEYPVPANPIYPYIKSIAFTYDNNSNVTKIEEEKVSSAQGNTITEITHKSYDSFDRLITVKDRDNKRIAYTYDNAGNRTTVTDPDNKTTTYTYNQLNRLVAVQNTDGTTQYSYYSDGLKQEIRYPNQTLAEYEYDKANRMTGIHNTGPTGLISQYQYTYDKNGNRLTMEETQQGITEQTSYTYDLVNRLTQVAYPADTQYPAGRIATYTYDQVGNRLTEVETDTAAQVLASKSFAYNDLNWLTEITDNLGVDHVLYEYDQNGNMIKKTKAGITTDYQYDVKDYLRVVNDGTANLAVFDYNYDGMRITKIGNSGEVRYVYDDRAVLLETDAAGQTIAKYNYGDRLLSLSHKNQGTQFYHLTALGSTGNLTNMDGTVRCSYQYDAWGNFRKTAGSSWNRKTFTGKEWDEETGLFYFGARFYDPEIGRFITQDPYLGEINTPPSLHRYLYAYANPLRFIDLEGYYSWAAFWDDTKFTMKNIALFGKGAATAAGQMIYEPLATVYDLEQVAYYSITGEPEKFLPTSAVGKAAAGGAGTSDILLEGVTGIVKVPYEWGQAIVSGDPERIGRATFNFEIALAGASKGNLRRAVGFKAGYSQLKTNVSKLSSTVKTIATHAARIKRAGVAIVAKKVKALKLSPKRASIPKKTSESALKSGMGDGLGAKMKYPPKLGPDEPLGVPVRHPAPPSLLQRWRAKRMAKEVMKTIEKETGMNVRGYVDRITAEGTESGFSLDKNVKRVNLGSEAFSKGRANALVHGLHELGHSIKLQIKAAELGVSLQKAWDQRPRFGTQAYAIEEVAAQTFALKMASKILGRAIEDWELSHPNYIDFWNKVASK